MYLLQKLIAQYFIICFLFTGILSPATCAVQNENSDLKREGWILLWNDEFEGDTIDKGKWNVLHAALEKNNEAQFYASDEVYLEDGNLVLRSQKRKMGSREYTSGHVDTAGKFKQEYGRFEVRGKMPIGQGIWPAHWMLPADRSTWPPEIDIMEFLGHEPNTVHMTNHFGVWPDNRLEGNDFTGPNFHEDFHTFALEWEPNELRWYVDDELHHSTRQHVPKEPFYIILNTAVGGDWPGYPDETTEFPQYHFIDYVRVYALDAQGFHYLTTKANNGRITQDPDDSRYAKDTKVNLKATPHIGYQFSHWSGNAKGSRNPLMVIMDKTKKVTAHFKPSKKQPKLISQGRPVRVSSIEKPEIDGKKAVDGNTDTRWSSEFSDPQWITIDLGKVSRINAIRLHWETAYGRTYQIQASHDNKTWTTLIDQPNGYGGIEEFTELNTSARFVRMMGEKRGTQWGYSLFEFEVFT